MKNIEIITVYNSSNFGSIMQADCLIQEMSKFGYAYVADTKSRSLILPLLKRIKHSIVNASITTLLRTITFETKETVCLAIKWHKLKGRRRVHPDVYILGSDEIWNISRQACRYPIFWGEGLENAVAYAPSINDATLEDFNNSDCVNSLKRMKAISVRDQHSAKIISNIIGRDVAITLDPTLLNNPIKTKRTINKKYIAIYMFEWKTSKEQINEIVNYARINNLLLVSAGHYLPWCDMSVHSIDCNPFYVFQNAECVITNTFHGTAYSINYKKNFISFSEKKGKVYELLVQFGLSDRIADLSNMYTLLDKSVDYNKISALLENEREKSKRYIRNALLNKYSDEDIKVP